MSLATTRMLPSVVSRDFNLPSRRVRSSSDTAREVATFQKISTRDDVLLTCWPPAPEDRDTRISSSLLGMTTESLTESEFAVGGDVIRSAPAEQLERREKADKTPRDDDEELRRQRR